MKALAVAFMFVLVMSSSTMAELREPGKIIDEEGRFVFTDGVSFFLFEKGGAFQSAPLGLSGRVITGRWEFKPPRSFTIEGQWTWINGLSARDDFRKMTLIVSTPTSFEERQQISLVELIGPVRIYKCYFTVDEMIKMSPPNSVN